MDENPNTKNKLFINIGRRFVWASLREVPARYAKKPGIIGTTQGDRKEIIPARKAINIVVSDAILKWVI